MARSRNKNQRRKAKLKKRTPKPRASKPFRLSDGTKISQLNDKDDLEVRYFIRHQLAQNTEPKKLSAMLRVRAADIVGKMKKQHRVPDPEGFEDRIHDKLHLILEEEAFANAFPVLVDHPKIQAQAHRFAVKCDVEGVNPDAAKDKVEALIHQKLEEKQLRSKKRLEQVNREIDRIDRQKGALTDKFRKQLKEMSISELDALKDSIEERFEPDDAKPLKLAIMEASLGKKASEGVAERMALGMSEDEAIDHLVDDPKGNPMDDDLREMIREAFARGETAEQIEESLMAGSLQPGMGKRSRESGRGRLRKMVEEEGTASANATLDRISEGMSKEEREEFINQVVRKGGQGGLDTDSIQAIADEINARRGMHPAKAKALALLLEEVGEDDIIPLRVAGTGPRTGGVVGADLDGFVEDMDVALEPLTPTEREDFCELAINHIRIAKATGEPVDYLDINEAVQHLLDRRREDLRKELKAYNLDDYGNDTETEDRLFKAVRQLTQKERPAFYEKLSHHIHNKRGQPLNLDDLMAEVKGQQNGRPQPQFATGGAWDKYQTRKRPVPQEQSVECYMEMLTNAYKLTKGHKNVRLQREGVYLWRCLRDARVFHFDPDVYAGLHQEIDRYTTEELAGLTYRAPGTFDPKKARSPEGESDILRSTIFREAKRAPYPEKFPFPSVFIGHGPGLVQSRPFLMMSAPASLRERVEMGAVFGHLLTDDGLVISCVKAGIRDDDGQLMAAIWFDPLRHIESGWVRSEFNLEPWILPQLIKIINDHRTFILESNMSRELRKDYKKNRKGMGIKPDKRAYTPPPYYTLRMKSKLIRERVRKHLPRPAPPKTYKTDVIAHERCRVARGTLPLDPETGAKLKKRDYKIFTTNALDLDTYRRLHERGLPFKKADEWLAIKVSQIEAHMTSNDPNLPYIPAVRVPGEIHLKPKKPTGSWADDPAR